jgi:hypothetical protein
MSKKTVIILIIAAVICWVSLLVWSSNQRASVIKTQRIASAYSIENQNDCLVTARTSDGKIVKGYTESAACTYIKIGAKVMIENGVVRLY